MSLCYGIARKKKHGKKYHLGTKRFHKKKAAKRWTKKHGGTIRKLKCGKGRKGHHKGKRRGCKYGHRVGSKRCRKTRRK